MTTAAESACIRQLYRSLARAAVSIHASRTTLARNALPLLFATAGQTVAAPPSPCPPLLALTPKPRGVGELLACVGAQIRRHLLGGLRM